MAAIAIDLLAGLAAGIVLGAGYFALLWWATARLPASGAPAAAALGGAVVRLALVAGGLGLAGAGAPVRLVAGLAGFLIVRGIAIRRVRAAPAGGAGAPR